MRSSGRPAAGWRVFLGGQAVQLEIGDWRIARRLRELTGHLCHQGSRARLFCQVRRDGAGWQIRDATGECLYRPTRESTVHAVLYRLVEMAAAGRRRLAVVHAAAVGQAGRAVLLAGQGGSGKSVLAATLAGHGLDYLADDACVVDRHGRLLPLPMPQAIKPGGWAVLDGLFPALRLAPAENRAGAWIRYLPPRADRVHDGRQAWSVAAIVYVRYCEGAAGILRSLDPVQSLQRMMAPGVRHINVVAAERMQAFLRWLEGCRCFSLEFSDAEQARRGIDQLLRP